MTKKLEEVFNLDEQPDKFNINVDDVAVDDDDIILVPAEISEDTLSKINKVELALPTVKGLEASDKDMDSLAQTAQQSFTELMNLGMQADTRHAAEIFGVASSLLGHAITAKNAKVNKKLKMVELQLKQMRLQHEMDKTNHKKIIEGYGTDEQSNPTIDRNELLRELLKDATETSTKEQD